jgi:hypothetical protein
MGSHFFYPTATGSLGEARRRVFEEAIVKRESETPPPQSSGQSSDRAVRSNPTLLIAEDTDDRLHSDSTDVAI